MDDTVGISDSISTFLPPLPQRSHATTSQGLEISLERPPFKAAIIAGAFLLLNLVAYLSAGYLGMTFFKWVWYRFLG
jgi:hypothetical protein